MKQPVTINFVSNVAIPCCAIGLSSLQVALSRPGNCADGYNLVEHIGNQYGPTPQQVNQAQVWLQRRGSDVAFALGPRKRIHDTFDATPLDAVGPVSTANRYSVSRRYYMLTMTMKIPRAAVTFWSMQRIFGT
jgi:hypothetical protein